MNRRAALAIGVAAAAALCACATETLGTRTPGETGDPATIAASARLWGKIPDAMSPVVFIDSVDGQGTKSSTSRVLVAPGHHTLSVTCRYGTLRKSNSMALDAEPGGYYEISVAPEGGAGSCEAVIRELK